MGCAVSVRETLSASTMSLSGASAAPPSTITIASLEHATMRSMSAAACCSNVGNATRSPLTRATRTPASEARPTGWSEMWSAALAPVEGEGVGPG